MTREEIAKYRQELRNILVKDNGKRMEELEQLAKKVGAGYIHTKIAGITTRKIVGTTLKEAILGNDETTIYQNPITESELVLNINNALQIETMIDMCKTAAKNVWIAVIAASAAVVSALVALLANC